jgi:hypothetical protein
MFSRSVPTWRNPFAAGWRPRPQAPVFGNPTKHTNLLIQFELMRAGIPFRDASDRVADVHALRHSYITALAMSQAKVKVIQSLARHSTPVLSLGIHAHVGLFDQTAALDALPAATPSPKSEPDSLAATRTESGSARVAHGKRAGDGSGRELSVICEHDAVSTASNRELLTRQNPIQAEDLDASDRPMTL